MSDVSYPPIDTSALMPRAEAETTIAGFEARIASMEAKKHLQLLGTATVGDTALIALTLGVKRYNATVPGAAVGDRIVLTLTGAPQNGSVQDAYVSGANTVNIGVLTPALAIGSVVSVPVAIYKVV